MSDALGRNHMAAVASLSCVLCERLGLEQMGRTTVHHARFAAGNGQRSDDFLTIALCADCHQGKQGIHGNRQRLYQANVDEPQLLADTYRALEACNG